MINILYWIVAVLIAYSINSYGPVDSTANLWFNSLIGGTFMFVAARFVSKYKPWEK